MVMLEIDGTRVEVEDDFLDLTPEQQGIEVDAIAAELGRQQRPQIVNRGPKRSQIPEGRTDNVGTGLNEAFENERLSAAQGVSPAARDFLDPVGRVVQTAGGDFIDDGTGNLTAFDPDSQFVAQDQQTGEFMVFPRDPEFEESKIASFARLFLPGVVSSAPAVRASLQNVKAPGFAGRNFQPANVTTIPKQSEVIAKQATRAVDEAGQFGVRLSRGDATQDFAQQAREAKLARADGTAGDTVREFRAGQADDIQAAARNIGEDLAGGGQFGDRVEDAAGELITSAVQQRARDFKEPAQQLYDLVSDSGATVKVDAVSDLRRSVQASLEAEGLVIDPVLHPTAAAMLKRMSDLSDLQGAARPIVPNADIVDDVVGVSFKAIEGLNKQINKLKGTTADDMNAMKEVKRAFSTWLENLGDSAFLTGNSEVIDQFKEANSLWRQYRQITNPRTGDAAGKFLAKIEANEVSIEEVGRAIVSMAENGLGNERALQIARRIGETIGKDSEAWAALRQAAWIRLTQTPEGLTGKGAQKIAQNIAQFTKGKGRGLARELFTPIEQELMRRFANVLRKTVPPAGVENPPNSGFIASKLLTPIGDKLLAALAATTGGLDIGFGALVGLPLFRFAKQTRQATTATTRPIPKVRGVPEGPDLSQNSVKMLLFGGQAALQTDLP